MGQLLITSAWIEGEAESLGVSVTQAAVDAEFSRIRRSAFKTLPDYRKFLRESGESERDIKWRTKIDLLSTAIRAQVVSDVGQGGLDSWVKGFQAKWKSLTRCRKQYRISLCGSTF